MKILIMAKYVQIILMINPMVLNYEKWMKHAPLDDFVLQNAIK